MTAAPCPCGCGSTLVLSSKDASDARRLAVIAGLATGGTVSLKLPVRSSRFADEQEPVTSGTCRGCGKPMQLFAYLAHSLSLRSAPWPKCDACGSRQ